MSGGIIDKVHQMEDEVLLDGVLFEDGDSAEDRAKDQRIKEAYRDLKVALKKMADDIDERNTRDPDRAFNAFNPRQLEWSVSG